MPQPSRLLLRVNMTTLSEVQEKYGLLTEAEAACALRRAERGLSLEAAAASVRSERVALYPRDAAPATAPSEPEAEPTSEPSSLVTDLSAEFESGDDAVPSEPEAEPQKRGRR